MEPPRNVTSHVYAYRAWRLFGSHLVSFSVGLWPSDKPMQATCIKNFFGFWGKHGITPDEECGCGVYAWKHIPEKWNLPSGIVPVYGVVELTGKVIVHQRGYRAQYARPVAVQYAEGIEKVAERYRLIILEDLKDWA